MATSGGGGSLQGGMTGANAPQDDADGLDELRAELARFVLREAGQAVAADPDLPLSAAFTRAIREEAKRAAPLSREVQPTPQDLAASVMEAIRPELIQVVRATARGEAAKLERRGVGAVAGGLSRPVVAGIAAAVLLAAFAIGFGAAWVLKPDPEPAQPPAPVESFIPPEPTTTDPSGSELDPTAPATSSSTPADETALSGPTP